MRNNKQSWTAWIIKVYAYDTYLSWNDKGSTLVDDPHEALQFARHSDAMRIGQECGNTYEIIQREFSNNTQETNDD